MTIVTSGLEWRIRGSGELQESLRSITYCNKTYLGSQGSILREVRIIDLPASLLPTIPVPRSAAATINPSAPAPRRLGRLLRGRNRLVPAERITHLPTGLSRAAGCSLPLVILPCDGNGENGEHKGSFTRGPVSPRVDPAATVRCLPRRLVVPL
jgi:hypothetical protein